MNEVEYCDHCGRRQVEAHSSGSTRCAPPFIAQPHSFTGKHPADRRRQKEDLLNLLERADVPDEKLFTATWFAIIQPQQCSEYSLPDGKYYEHKQRFDKMLDAEAWTSAAEMLVPPKYAWAIGNDCAEDATGATATIGAPSKGLALIDTKASHPALALLAAIVRSTGGIDETP